MIRLWFSSIIWHILITVSPFNRKKKVILKWTGSQKINIRRVKRKKIEVRIVELLNKIDRRKKPSEDL